MGAVILFGLFVLAVVALISPALRARMQSRREHRRQSAHEEVVRRLDNHRRSISDQSRDDTDGE